MKRRKLPPRDASGHFRKRKPLPPRDASGHFRKRKPLPPRDASGHFRKRKPVRARKGPPRKPPIGFKQHKPVFNLCFAADREDFYNTIIEDRKKLRKTLTEEQMSALRVRVEIIGQPKKKRGHKRRRTTAFIGTRTFSDMRNLRRFLVLDSGADSGRTGDNPYGLDWRKKALCQFEKRASLVIRPERKRGSPRTLRKYKLES